MKYLKKGNKFYKVEEREINKKALQEEKALLQGRFQELQDRIDEINNILK